jgi:phytoene dehydrogenase-like protein
MSAPGPDVVVIGAGHNGLAAAAYLARGGLRVQVLERRGIVGGACVTEELWPGHRVSRAAYVAGLLRPALVRELGLAGRGLRLLARHPSSFTPLRGDPGLLLGPDPALCRHEIGRFSARDAEAYPRYEALLDGCARALEPLLDVPPPDPLRPRLRDLPTLFRVARGLRRLGRELPRALGLLLGAARPVLERFFESEPLRATLATDALIGAWAGPSSPGTGYVLFHHVMGETNGERGVWAYVEGGMGRLSEALAAAAREAGAEIRLEAPVSRVLLHDRRAAGVRLEDGSTLEARAVVSNADPRRTLLGLVGAEHLAPELAREVAALDFRSPSLKLNLVLDRLPRFGGRSSEGVGPEHVGTIHVGSEDLDALERSFAAAAAGRLPERPMLELTIPSSLDPSLAPQGRYVASLFVQHVPFEIAGSSWDAEREAFADRVLAQLDEVAPGFAASVVRREVLAPPDLERIFALSGGNLFHGAMTPERLLFLRPLPGWSRYRTPIEGLYLCGAGTHPGGGVMGACGRNAAAEILRDLRGQHPQAKRAASRRRA